MDIAPGGYLSTVDNGRLVVEGEWPRRESISTPVDADPEWSEVVCSLESLPNDSKLSPFVGNVSYSVSLE